MFLKKIKEKIMFLTMAHKQEKKKDGNLMWCNYFTEYIKKKLMISISQATKPKLSTKKKKSNKPQKMENNELVEER